MLCVLQRSGKKGERLIKRLTYVVVPDFSCYMCACVCYRQWVQHAFHCVVCVTAKRKDRRKAKEKTRKQTRKTSVQLGFDRSVLVHVCYSEAEREKKG